MDRNAAAETRDCDRAFAGRYDALSLLTWFYQQQREHAFAGQIQAMVRLRLAALIALFILACQIALGGWVSTNYAAAACGELPTCQNAWLPDTDFEQGFHIVRDLGKTATGEHLSLAALTAIHLTHRGFAFLVIAVVGALAWRARKLIPLHGLGTGLLLALAVQVCLGFSVVFSMSSSHLHLLWQLPLAAAHNAGAALLLVLLVTLNYRCYAASRE
jgi:heme a synthase